MVLQAHAYTEDLQQIDACRPELLTRLPHAMNEITTPLDRREWESALAGHPDQKFREYVVNGILNGFRIGFNYTNTACRKSGKNLPSVREHLQVVRDYLAEECAQGRILGPLDPESFPQLHTSVRNHPQKHSG